MFSTHTLTGRPAALLLAGAIAASGALAAPARAQIQVQIGPQPAPQPAYAAPSVVPLLNNQQLDQLTGPVALYPDPLLAVMLPAATYPDEINAAARMVQQFNPSPEAIDAQPWDPSVKALAHSPSILLWMYENPDWTGTLGTAFTYQPQDVMNSIQHLRAQALAVGSLFNTPQQVVVTEGNYICIEPAVANELYVPVYDWHDVYRRRIVPTYFPGLSVGLWLNHDLDWDRHDIVLGAHWDRGWEHRWDDDRGARVARVNIRADTSGHERPAEVRIGGEPWHRDETRRAPTLPQSIHPADRVPIDRAPVRMRNQDTGNTHRTDTPNIRTEVPHTETPRNEPTRTETPTIPNEPPRTGAPTVRPETPRETPSAAPEPAKPVSQRELPHLGPPQNGLRATEPPARGREGVAPARGNAAEHGHENPPARGDQHDHGD